MRSSGHCWISRFVFGLLIAWSTCRKSTSMWEAGIGGNRTEQRRLQSDGSEEAADRLPGLRDHSSIDDYGRCRLGHRWLPPPQGNPPSTMPASCARPCDVGSRYAMPEPSILS
jgi:hypothetical protein